MGRTAIDQMSVLGTTMMFKVIINPFSKYTYAVT